MIDIRTMSFAAAFVALVLVVPFLVLAGRRPALPGVPHWAAGMFVGFLGLLLLGLRNTIPDVVSITLATSLILASYAAILRGMRDFVGDRQRPWLDFGPLVISAAAAELFSWPWTSVAVRIMAFAAFSVLYLILGTVVIWRGFPRVTNDKPWVLLTTFVVYAAWNAARAVLSLIIVSPSQDFMSSGLYQALTFFPGIAWTILTGTSLLVATIRRIEMQAGQALRASERRFSSAFQYAAIGMAIVSPDGHWIKVNRAVCEILGYSEEELRAMRFQDITHPGDLEADLDQVRRLLDGRIESYRMEKRYIHRDGHLVWVLLSVSLHRDDSGQPIHFISQLDDITTRKIAEEENARAAEALRASEEHFRNVFINAPFGYFRTNFAGRLLEANPACAAMLGYQSPESLIRAVNPLGIGKALFQDPRERDRILGEVLQKDSWSQYQVAFLRMDREDVTANVFLRKRSRPDGAVELEGMSEDITERARHLSEIEKRVARLSALNEIGRAVSAGIELQPMLEAVHRQVSRVLDAAHFFVATLDEAGDSWTMQYKVDRGRRCPIESHPMGYGLAGHVIRSRRGLRFETVAEKAAFVAREGIAPGWPEARSWMGVPLVAADTVVGAMAVQSYELEHVYGEDDFDLLSTIAAQVAFAIQNSRLFEATCKMLQEVAESEERYRTLVETANDAVAIVQDDRVVFCNRRLPTMLDRPQESIIGQAFTDFVSPKDRDLLRENYQRRLSGESLTTSYDIRLVDRSGREIWVIISAARILYQGRPATMGFLTDISERIDREKERERLVEKLTLALQDNRVLHGLLPICAGCKRIRDDTGYWSQLEHYISLHAPVEFSHGMCPECIRKYYPEVSDEILGDTGSRLP